jgi:hypothetical protein
VARYSARLRGLAQNLAVPPEVLDRLVAVADFELCLDLTERDDLSPAQVRTLAATGGLDATLRLVYRGLLGPDDIDLADPWLGLAVLDGPAPPPGLAAQLAVHADPRVREALARVEPMPDQVLLRLARDEEVDVVAAAAASAGLTDDLAASLARHPHLEVRRAVAGNDRAPAGLLASLVEDGGSPPPRWCAGCDGMTDPLPGMECDGRHLGARVNLDIAVAGNPACGPQLLSVLADHPSAIVRWTVAARLDLPPDAVRRLARDPIPGVLMDLAANPVIDPLLMAALAASPDPAIRRAVARNPAIPLRVLIRLAATTRLGPVLLPRIAATTPAEAAELSRSRVPEVRMLVAQRPGLAPEVLATLAGDLDAKVLRSLAAQPGLTPTQLRSIVDRHGGARVAGGVAANPGCPADLLCELARQHAPARRALKHIARHPNATASALLACLADRAARPVAARHPALPAHVLVGLLDDPDDEVAEAAAANPALPFDAMRALLAE